MGNEWSVPKDFDVTKGCDVWCTLTYGHTSELSKTVSSHIGPVPLIYALQKKRRAGPDRTRIILITDDGRCKEVDKDNCVTAFHRWYLEYLLGTEANLHMAEYEAGLCLHPFPKKRLAYARTRDMAAACSAGDDASVTLKMRLSDACSRVVAVVKTAAEKARLAADSRLAVHMEKRIVELLEEGPVFGSAHLAAMEVAEKMTRRKTLTVADRHVVHVYFSFVSEALGAARIAEREATKVAMALAEVADLTVLHSMSHGLSDAYEAVLECIRDCPTMSITVGVTLPIGVLVGVAKAMIAFVGTVSTDLILLQLRDACVAATPALERVNDDILKHVLRIPAVGGLHQPINAVSLEWELEALAAATTAPPP
jgi:hypothetical protein